MMARLSLVLAAALSIAVADVVITKNDAFRGEIVSVDAIATDTFVVRLKIATGGIRVIPVADIIEVRTPDQSKADWISGTVPSMKVVVGEDGEVPPLTILPTQPDSNSLAKDDPIRAGAWLLGGGASLSVQSVANVTSTTLSITPGISYFVARGIGLGGELNVASTAVGGNSNSTTFLGLKATGAFGPKDSRLFMLAEFGLGTVGSGGSTTRTTLGIGVLPVAASHLGVPLKLALHLDRTGGATLSTWLLSVGMCALVH